MRNLYVLIDRKVVPCDDLIQWAGWNEAARKSGATDIAKDTVNGVYVSTIFLTVDHSFLGGPPVLFETMVFPESYDPKDSSTWGSHRMYRYCTIEEAEAGHKAIVEALQEEHVSAGAETRAVLGKIRKKVFGGE